MPCSSALRDFLLTVPEKGLFSLTNGETALSSGTALAEQKGSWLLQGQPHVPLSLEQVREGGAVGH